MTSIERDYRKSPTLFKQLYSHASNLKFSLTDGCFIDAVKSVQLYVQEVIPFPVHMDGEGAFRVKSFTRHENIKYFLQKFSISFQIFSSIFSIHVWMKSEATAQITNLLNLLVAIHFAVVAFLPLILLFWVKRQAHEFCFVANEFCKEMIHTKERHKSVSRFLIGSSALVTYISAASFLVPFTNPNDPNVVVLSGIANNLLGSWLSEFSLNVFILPVLTIIATCIPFGILECVLVVMFITVGIMDTVRNCTSVKYYKTIQIKVLLSNNIMFAILPVMISALLIICTLPLAILISRWSLIDPMVRFNVVASGTLLLGVLILLCNNMGSIQESCRGFLIGHMKRAKNTGNQVELRRVQACPLIHLNVGIFGYFDRCISLTFLDLILNNTVTVLLFAKTKTITSTV